MATVVTGAGGHVGACLLRTLLEQGREVRALDLDHGPGVEGLDVDIRKGDIREADYLASCIEPGDTVFHLASVISTVGDKGGLVPSVNVGGARNVATVCAEKGAKRLIHFSSIHAFDIDTHGATVTEETRPATANSRSAYNCSKWEGQSAVLEVAGKTGLDAVVVNPCGIIGPYDYKPSRMGKFLRAYMRGKALRPGPGGFNWVDVRDVVAGALLAEEKGRSGESYILGGQWNLNMELSRRSAAIVGIEPPPGAIPWWVVNSLAAFGPVLRAMGMRPPVTREALDALRSNRDMSHAKAAQELGYAPRPIDETLDAFFKWLTDEDIVAKERARRKAQREG